MISLWGVDPRVVQLRRKPYSNVGNQGDRDCVKEAWKALLNERQNKQTYTTVLEVQSCK
jgi:hypothetical protein